MSPPFGVTVPLSVAVFVSTLEADSVVASGFATVRVVSVSSAPSTVPTALVATRRKTYVRPGARPLRLAVTETESEPEPAPTFAVLEPSEAVDVPYSNS